MGRGLSCRGVGDRAVCAGSWVSTMLDSSTLRRSRSMASATPGAFRAPSDPQHGHFPAAPTSKDHRGRNQDGCLESHLSHPRPRSLSRVATQQVASYTGCQPSLLGQHQSKPSLKGNRDILLKMYSFEKQGSQRGEGERREEGERSLSTH